MSNLNLNTFPYFDDYDAEKGFHKILFKPGYSVQARELTQLQTILQEQVKRFGSHVFKEGSVVIGCAETINFNVPYIKILDTNALGVDLDSASLDLLEGVQITGQTNNVKAVIKKVATGLQTEDPNLKTLYIQYTETGNNNISLFVAGETVSTLDGKTFVVAGSSTSSVGEGSLFSVGDGIIFANGNFIYHEEQTIVLDRYSTTPTKKVGIIVREVVVDSSDDETLLDPAQGSYNYTAPGADRYRLYTTLVAYDISEEYDSGFYVFFDIESGRIKRKYNSSQYAELNKVLARRTFDESGDYTIRPFPLIVREHYNNGSNNGRYLDGDISKLVIGVEPGKAYVKGYEHELFSTEYVETNKATAAQVYENVPTTTSFGNYVEVNGLAGIFPINQYVNIELMDGASVVGTAKVRALENFGTSTYRLYLYDVVMDTGIFSDITSVRYTPNSATANIVGTAQLKNSKYSAAIFKLPYENVKDLSGISYVYRKIVATTSSSGIATATITSPETWAFTNGGANDVFVLNASNAIVAHSSAIVISNVLTVTGIGGSYTGNVTLMVLVRRTSSQNSKSLRKDRFVTINTTTHPETSVGPYNLGISDVISVSGVWQSADSTAFPADPWNPVGDSNWIEVTDNFVVDNGQTDGAYTTASIKPIIPVVNKKLIVKLSYYEHGTGSGFYTLNSYPLPAENVAPSASQINWYDLPSYTSVGGETYDLRNSLDFRPTVAATAANSTTIAGASLNPAAGTTFSSGFTHPEPSEELIADISVYLPRIDRVVLDTDGNFYVVVGTPSISPTSPRQPNNCMTLGYVSIAPYPSLSPSFARTLNKPQYACRVSLVDNKRYTMRDIGDIQKRLDNLEYYTNLSLLEQDTAKLSILSDIGLDRYKNGILVDSFIGHNIGNVYLPSYKCSISDGILRPSYGFDSIQLEVKEGSSFYTKANDATIVVRQQLNASKFAIGDAVENDSDGFGIIIHAVVIAENSDENYVWLRLYLSDVTGSFGSGNTVTSSGKTGVITYGIEIDSVLETSLKPDLVSYDQEGDLITLPYTHSVYAQNPHASKFRKVSSKLLFNYVGNMSLSPSSDMIFDTRTQPEIQYNDYGKMNNWEVMENAWGTEWGIWEKSWYGKYVTQTPDSQPVPSDVTETTAQRLNKGGTGIQYGGYKNTTIGQRIISNDLLPFIRSRIIQFSATGMKPNTLLNAYFDGINVSDFCKMTEDSVYGSSIVVNASGNVSGYFRIPENTFTIGTKVFVLTDSSSNPFDSTAKTVSIASYGASGVLVNEVNDILSTSSPESTLGRQLQTQESVVSRLTRSTDFSQNVSDPIAQTFVIGDKSSGVMLSKIDLYFKTRSSLVPITLQIRETNNGFPTEVIVPNSSVTLSPKDVNVSEIAASPTEFKFKSPIYLKNDTEYCFVLIPAGNSEDYSLWTSELGGIEIGGTSRVDVNPYIGNLLVAGNNQTWTTLINEDIKFTIYSCKFDTTTTGSVLFQNMAEDYLKLSGDVSIGDYIVSTNGIGLISEFNADTITARVKIISGTFAAGPIFVCSKILGTFTAIDSSNVVTGVGSNLLTQVVNGTELITQDGVSIGVVETVVSNTNIELFSNAAVDVASENLFKMVEELNIVSIETFSVDAIAPSIAFLNFNNSTINWEYKIFDVTSLMLLDYESLQTNVTYELQDRKYIHSNSTIPETFLMRAVFNTATENISPVIDKSKVGSIIAYNLINNSSTDETTDFGAASSKYITKRVVLDNGQEAEDLRVYVNAEIPFEANILVYAKLLNNNTDQTPFSERPWILMDEITPLDSIGYSDYYYTLPSSVLNSGVYNYTTGSATHVGFKTFAIKIVFLSTSPTKIPRIKNMRAIALQA